MTQDKTEKEFLSSLMDSKDLRELATRICCYGSYDFHGVFVDIIEKYLETGAQWQKERLINKACEWLEKESDIYIGYYDKQGLIDNFRKAMEEEK